MINDAITLSIVVPMFNEQAVLPTFFERLNNTLRDLNLTHEIICVDDGSSDQTATVVAKIALTNRSIKLIQLSRNFGKEVALTAGLDYSKGMAVVPLDADLQEPPEAIRVMLERWQEGFDIVLAIRSRRDTDSWLKPDQVFLLPRVKRDRSSDQADFTEPTTVRGKN